MSVDRTTSLERVIVTSPATAIVCELAWKPCDNPADWWHVLGCCAGVLAKCSPHKYGVLWDGTPGGPPKPGDVFVCPRCGTEDDGMSDRWEPIR